jgi:UDP-2-acetamido-2,6-beta-L-arabino-hexul-4-ose reductase
MRIALSGANGFLGWHVRVLLHALGWPEPVLLTRADLADPDAVGTKLTGTDRLLHLAGANRGDHAEVVNGNIQPAAALARGLGRAGAPPREVVFANSIQAGNRTPYGEAKATAAGTLADAAACNGCEFADVRLANLYGEHGRPFYNSVVATFCRLLSEDRKLEVRDDRELTLVHALDAAAHLIGAPPNGPWDTSMPGLRIGVPALADRLTRLASVYRNGDIPELSDRHDVRLFNTYRSHCFPGHYPMPLSAHADRRGSLVEVVKVHGGSGQSFCSTSAPGVTRGDHFHLAKVERFVVVRGSAVIALRRAGHREVLRFPVSGEDPVLIDMPTMWVHNIINTGPDELLTLFWANDLFDPAHPDTYFEPVEDPVRDLVEVTA